MLIVTYHAIDARPSPVCTAPERLAWHVARLRGAGFRFVSLDECAAWLVGGVVADGPAVAITFDDGYASVIQQALPILAAEHVPATLFSIGGRRGSDNRWPSQWASVPTMPLADDRALREWLAAGMAVGAHTWSHCALPSLEHDEAEREIVEAGDRLAQALGTEVRHFAYPYGLRTARDVRLAERRYLTAVTAEPGVVRRTSSQHDLPRLDAHDLHVGLRLGLVGTRRLVPYLAARRGFRRVRRRLEGTS